MRKIDIQKRLSFCSNLQRYCRLGAIPFFCAAALQAGNLFVSDSGVGDNKVLQYNGSTGAPINDPFVPTGSGGLNAPNGVAFGADGNLYVASNGNSEVLQYNGSTGAFMSVFVSSGSGGLNGPIGIVFGPDGSLYVTSAVNSEVLKYNGSTGAFMSVFVSSASGGLSKPIGIVFGPDGNLYVASALNSEVLKYNGSTGTFVSVFVTTGSGGLSVPGGVVFGADGNLYVTSSGANAEVLKYNGSTGAFMSVFVSNGSGGLAQPIGLVFGPDGNLYVADYHNSEVLQYNGSTGAFISTFVSRGSGGLNGAATFLIFGPAGPADIGFQVHYSANLNIGESYIDIANDGANGASLLGPGFGAAAGNLCVNVYAFDPNEELVSCCSCLVTPDQTVHLGVNADLTSKTLTGVVPTSVTVKLVATLAGTGGSGTGTVCNNSAASITGPAQVVFGMAAWGTTLHQTQTTGAYATTETPFTAATLSAGELNSIVGRCAAIIGNASGFGICTSCHNGALGGQKL